MSDNLLRDWIRDHPFKGPFRPHVYLHRPADVLTVYWEDADHYAVRGGDGFDLFRAQEDDRVIGVRIWGVSRLLTPATSRQPGGSRMKTLYRDRLDAVASGGCQSPGCDHTEHVQEPVFLHARCHVKSRLHVSYQAGSGVLHVACAECGGTVANVAVAAAPLVPVESLH